ncbi:MULTISPECIES: carbon monoxide dehydrogenase/acetyl-CoA synthase methytransferase subunit [unclassified Clostridioides]|uniref:carbon monoxide dehydrogenase/acetyl-CoA synthase methytransferase subunit n=1 Tax=unclassified Clostridioides TaxID=2635829 RepID=UPI001D0C6FA0|nr:dihydropteroate synthase [Clostridioides sp. ZZV15-6388]MCC0635945.1 dihydropteroate synthase [Clostridioides sp. ES-S-0001-02]MCC0640794.1 dihydropteroate synthase [Clostridioides sp. ES-S-0049-03]MCC0644844.1 dihydropteroate synthase [Clostridioides sp. ZZV14-6150]MCC0653336.1 dihydropteroate synthase [Clostridioides sp. ES-S-0001-03]MCC0661426.1 dihydropteroate synthase [Clostridioides sp. ZZV14-6154]MCC0662946.1 dihydropteroate synthase [Clostridioides sp. ZZV15-6597]MCC0668694.1 dihy
MEKFMIIGERIHCISPSIRKALAERDPAPILKRAKEQLEAGAHYIDFNIGPAERDGEEIMTWGVKLLQSEFNNVPIALDTANKKAIEAGLKVYDRTNAKPIINSADAGSRFDLIDIAAEYESMVIGLCAKEGIPRDNDERMAYCQEILEKGLMLGMEPTDILFDPLCLVIKGMQEKQVEVLEAIKMMTEMGLLTTGGLSNVSNGCPKHVRPVLDSAFLAMAMANGFSSAIMNPCDPELMKTVKSCDIINGASLYADSFLELNEGGFAF